MATNLTLPMNFSNTRVILAPLWSSVWVRGERGTVVGHDAELAIEGEPPILRVLFADGRVGLHKMSELGAR
jgi:hypothetical protein